MAKATKTVKKKPGKHPLVAAIFGPTRNAPPPAAELNGSLADFFPGGPARPKLDAKPAPARVIPSEPLPRPRKRRRKNRKHPIMIQIEKREREIVKLKATAKMLGLDMSGVRKPSDKPSARARRAELAAKINAPLQ